MPHQSGGFGQGDDIGFGQPLSTVTGLLPATERAVAGPQPLPVLHEADDSGESGDEEGGSEASAHQPK